MRQPTGGLVVGPGTLNDISTQLTAGLQVGRSNVWCTLGAFVRTPAGEVRALTNSHCSTTEWGSDYGAEWYYQPEEFSDGTTLIGTERFDPPGTPCQWVNLCRGSDANMLTVQASNVPASVGTIAKPTYRSTIAGVDGSKQIDAADPLFYIMGERSAAVGESVDKVGARTGWTGGQVQHTCADVASSTSTTHVRTCQTVATYWADHGDSGSPVFQFAGIPYAAHTVYLLGVNWTVSANGIVVYSPIANIHQDLAAGNSVAFSTLYAPAAPALTVSILGSENPTAGTSQTYTAAVAGGPAPYTYEWRQDGTFVGAGSTFTLRTPAAPFTLTLALTDAAAATATTSLVVTPTACSVRVCAPEN